MVKLLCAQFSLSISTESIGERHVECKRKEWQQCGPTIAAFTAVCATAGPFQYDAIATSRPAKIIPATAIGTVANEHNNYTRCPTKYAIHAKAAGQLSAAKCAKQKHNIKYRLQPNAVAQKFSKYTEIIDAPNAIGHGGSAAEHFQRRFIEIDDAATNTVGNDQCNQRTKRLCGHFCGHFNEFTASQHEYFAQLDNYKNQFTVKLNATIGQRQQQSESDEQNHAVDPEILFTRSNIHVVGKCTDTGKIHAIAVRFRYTDQ